MTMLHDAGYGECLQLRVRENHAYVLFGRKSPMFLGHVFYLNLVYLACIYIKLVHYTHAMGFETTISPSIFVREESVNKTRAHWMCYTSLDNYKRICLFLNLKI